jgi:hypothetical protein
MYITNGFVYLSNNQLQVVVIFYHMLKDFVKHLNNFFNVQRMISLSILILDMQQLHYIC